MTAPGNPAGPRGLLLRRYADGGVVVNLRSGDVYRVNETAALICDAVVHGRGAELNVAGALGVAPSEARNIIEEVMQGLTAPPVRTPPTGAYHFLAANCGYVIQDGAHAVLSLDGDGRTVRLLRATLSQDLPQLELYMRALAPKLLFQHGVAVLHASACLAPDGRLIAFAGLSGAGKTTTARAFATGSFRLVSEDLVALAGDPAQGRAALNAEAAIHEWARDMAAELSTHPSGLAVRQLDYVVHGPTAQIGEVLFVDRARRAGDRFKKVPLTKPDALVALLPHHFLGAREEQSWRRYLAEAGALVDSVPMAELWSPDGIEQLQAAAPSYTTNRTS